MGTVLFSFLAKIVKKDFQLRSNETSAAIWAIFKEKRPRFDQILGYTQDRKKIVSNRKKKRKNTPVYTLMGPVLSGSLFSDFEQKMKMSFLYRYYTIQWLSARSIASAVIMLFSLLQAEEIAAAIAEETAAKPLAKAALWGRAEIEQNDVVG